MSLTRTGNCRGNEFPADVNRTRISPTSAATRAWVSVALAKRMACGSACELFRKVRTQIGFDLVAFQVSVTREVCRFRDQR